MSEETNSLLYNIGAIGIIAGAVLIFTQTVQNGSRPTINSNGDTNKRTSENATSTDTLVADSTNTTLPIPAQIKKVVGTPSESARIVKQDLPVAPQASTTASDVLRVTRISSPYAFPPQSFDVINNQTRLALVNIFCGARNGTFKPISASGVIIDPRGVILTNAHVAQYFLLSSSPIVDLSCVIRSGSPAYPLWKADVLFIPPSWVKAHAGDIVQAKPVGTGEYDYALLRITENINGQPLPVFPFVPMDTREAIGFTDDSVLVASYPAEFVGGISTQLNLYPVSSVTNIKNMLTFDNRYVDAISLGGIIGAQSGSSGGGVVNAWGQLVGIISTTSEGATTDARDLHAVTLSYINRSIVTESGRDLQSILSDDVVHESNVFNATIAPSLRQLLIDQIRSTDR
jgi:S1-C subfamily serine protease